MKIRIYYNPFKGVFVAKRDDGSVVMIDRDFGVVDTAAYKESSCVEYDLNSFPEMVRDKVLGISEMEKSRESYKSTLMRLIFSYRDVIPPDSITRSLARKITRKGLEIEKVMSVDKKIYVVAKRATEVFVYEIRHDPEIGWKYCVIKDRHQLPEDVLKYLEGGKNEVREAEV